MTPAERLAALIRIPTVSDAASRDEATFAAFRALLAELYPLVHEHLEQQDDGSGAIHRVWRGGGAAPTVLMAHHDVVPVTDQRWRRDPFGGEVVDDVLHGRGALDDKGPLVAVLEAIEGLLAEGFVPAGDVHVVSGDDEETRGAGARSVAERLAASGVRPSLVVDEGGAVVDGVVPGVRGPLAMIGLTERGMADVRLTTRCSGGHAAIPPKRQATVRLATALTRIERHPFPARSNPAIVAMAAALGPRLPGPAAAVLRSRVSAPAVAQLLAALGGASSALVRTTVAVTRLRAGEASNVLAAEATAHLNVRIAPGGTVQGVLERLRRVIRDPSVDIELVSGEDPPALSRADGPAWQRMVAALAVSHPEALPVPYVMVQASDARHFSGLGAEVYRFMPFAITGEELAAIHGADERVQVASLDAAIDFHRALLTRG